MQEPTLSPFSVEIFISYSGEFTNIVAISGNRIRPDIRAVTMTTFFIVFISIIALFAFIIIFGISIFNKLITGRNKIDNSFQQIDVQLQRRHDLIPNLVEVAQAYMQHEKSTLSDVIEARNHARAVAQDGRNEARDMAALMDRQVAEAALGGALGRLMAVVESYPDLKADQNMRQLSEELTSTENRIAFARQAFNDAVMFYNNSREIFPNNLIATGFSFDPVHGWEMDDPAAREPVQVSFQ